MALLNLYYCSVKGCKNNTADMKNLIMYKFPRSKKRRAQWAELVGRPDLLNKEKLDCDRVCEVHFNKNMRKNNKLIATAYPNINLLLTSDSNIACTSYVTPSTSINTNVEEPSSSRETDIKIEIDDVMELEKEIADMETSTNILLKECKTGQVRFGRSRFMDIYESLHNQIKDKYQGYMYKKKFRLHCLNLYCKAPKAYSIFKTTFALPSVKKLKKTRIILPPGINVNFINLVGKQLQNIPKSKHIIVCLEEMEISKHLYYDIRHDNITGFNNVDEKKTSEIANYAFIISIRGVSVNYTQMIGYCLVNNVIQNGDINRWIDNTIRRLFAVGLHVCAVVSKQTPRLELLASCKGISANDPCFDVDGKTIYYIFDLPQMINAVRDSLMSCDFLYDNKIASWDHLQILYQTEMNRRIRLAPKITYRHLEPTHAKTTQLQLTKEVFSGTVVAAMSADIDEGRLPSEARGTVDFFIKMNDLINVCNSTKIKHPNKFKRAFTGADYQTKTLSSAVIVFQNIQVINRTTDQDQTKATSCFGGLIVSLKAICRMYQDCRSSGLKYLLTERLHPDFKKMLDDLTQQRKNDFMTAIELKRSFSALALSHMIQNSTLTNYKGYLDRLILADEDANDFTLLEEYIPNGPKSSPLAIGTTDYRFELPVINIFRHVCSYILKKCSREHKCVIFREYLLKNKRLIPGDQRAKVLKAFTNMFIPPQKFIAYLHECEKIFIRHFDKLILKPNLGYNLLNLLHITNEFKPCPCFPTDYVKKLFLRIRIYNIIKFRNRRLNITLLV